MTDALPVLLLAATLLLVLLSGATWLVLRLQKQQQRLAARIGAVVTVHVLSQPVVVGAASAKATNFQFEAAPLVLKLGRWFGFNPDRSGNYPLRWWMVLPITLVVSRLLAGILITVAGWPALFAVPLLWVFLTRAFFKFFDTRRSRALYVQFPDALAMITRAVRVGIPVTESIRTVSREAIAPTNEEFGILADQISIGVALEDGLRELSERNSLPEYRFFATALALQAQTGGALSETLDNLADVIRKRVALRARAYALASEARTSIMILSALPVVAGGALVFLNPNYIKLLITDPTGQKVLACALMSLGTGIGIMKFIVKKSLS